MLLKEQTQTWKLALQYYDKYNRKHIDLCFGVCWGGNKLINVIKMIIRINLFKSLCFNLISKAIIGKVEPCHRNLKSGFLFVIAEET